jgi:hypothetical protein
MIGQSQFSLENNFSVRSFYMPIPKQTVQVQLREYHLSFLQDMMEKYKIPDQDKALRVLLDYAVQDADLDLVFDRKNMRCIACGGAV